MVHALKEAWRILAPEGVMIDVRPYSSDVPLEVIYDGGSDIAGIIDMSPGLAVDQDADKAIDSVIADQIYVQSKLEWFDFHYYWDTVKGMQEDIEECWKDEVIITDEVWRKARKLLKKRRPKAQIKVAIRRKLGVYEKNS